MNTKTRVLEILEKNRGKSISGEHLAGILSVSRNAVWKAIGELRKSGYQIHAAPNRGYLLSAENDIISRSGIGLYLTDENLTKQIFCHDVLESTNNTAKEMAMRGARHGTVVIAERQSGGRGRFERSFFSPPGCGVYLSVILRPERLWQAEPTIITAYAAIAVCEAIKDLTGKDAQIKWVNDIFWNGKKVCGILSEAVTDFESGQVGWIVVGIGINCSEPAGNYPAELENIIGSIRLNDGQITRNRLAAEVIRRMICPDAYPEPTEIIARYRCRLMFLGEKVLVNGWNESYNATALDIDESGHLLVQKEDGSVENLSCGEISVRTAAETTKH